MADASCKFLHLRLSPEAFGCIVDISQQLIFFCLLLLFFFFLVFTHHTVTVHRGWRVIPASWRFVLCQKSSDVLDTSTEKKQDFPFNSDMYNHYFYLDFLDFCFRLFKAAFKKGECLSFNTRKSFRIKRYPKSVGKHFPWSKCFLSLKHQGWFWLLKGRHLWFIWTTNKLR